MELFKLELNDNKKDDNPFFAGDKNDNVVNELFDQANIFLDKDSNREENNLFFQESDSSESLKESDEKSDFWSEPTFDKKNEEENVKKSVSPFFKKNLSSLSSSIVTFLRRLNEEFMIEYKLAKEEHKCAGCNAG